MTNHWVCSYGNRQGALAPCLVCEGKGVHETGGHPVHGATGSLAAPEAISWRARTFPFDFHARRPIRFFPARPEPFSAHTLEIGAGRGEYLFAQAAAHPDLIFAGIELSRRRYASLIARLQRLGLVNVFLMQGDARFVFPHVVPDRSLMRLVALFPDPWPKRRHAIQRLFTPEFLARAIRALKPGGEFLVKTDVQRYAEQIARHAAGLDGVSVVLHTDRPGDDGAGLLLTHFERRQRAAGCAIHTLRIVTPTGDL